MAIGIYYRQNVLKFRIMREVFFADHPLTCREIADLLDMPTGTISETMGYYNKQKPRKYFVRLKPKSGKEYRYKLTKIGCNYLARKQLLRLFIKLLAMARCIDEVQVGAKFKFNPILAPKINFLFVSTQKNVTS